MNHIYVSVIIPVYNERDKLRNCLEALTSQTYPESQYEIIVIDNNSEENIREIVSQFEQVILTHETTRGSYAARNKGISLAKGEILAFTDSDCIPDTSWLESGVSSLLSTPNCGLVGGKIEMFFQIPGKPNAIEVYDTIKNLQQKMYIEKHHYGATANIFTFKKMFDVVGYFDATLKSGGDCEWGRRVFSAGYVLLYADHCRVAHPARSSWKMLVQKTTRVLEGRYNLDLRDHQKHNKNNYLISNILPILWLIKPPFFFALRQASRYSKTYLKGITPKLNFLAVIIGMHYLRLWYTTKLKLGKS